MFMITLKHDCRDTRCLSNALPVLSLTGFWGPPGGRPLADDGKRWRRRRRRWTLPKDFISSRGGSLRGEMARDRDWGAPPGRNPRRMTGSASRRWTLHNGLYSSRGGSLRGESGNYCDWAPPLAGTPADFQNERFVKDIPRFLRCLGSLKRAEKGAKSINQAKELFEVFWEPKTSRKGSQINQSSKGAF